MQLRFCAMPDAPDVQAQLDELTKKMEELQKRQSAAAPSAAASGAVTGGDIPGSFKLPGSNTSVKLGGYAKLDAVFSDKSAGVGSTADLEYEAGAVPVGPQRVRTSATRSSCTLGNRASTCRPARQWLGRRDELSRVRPVRGERQRERVELARTARAARLRHTRSSARRTNVDHGVRRRDVSETVDFGGPAGVIFARQAQVRWSQPFSGGQWSIALENPETVVALPNGDSFRADDDRYPDIAGNVKFDTRWGKYSIAGLARQLRVDSASAPPRATRNGAVRVGVNGVVPLFHGDDVRFSAYYGNAIGRYSIGLFPDALLDTNAHLVLPKQWLAMAAYRHLWTADLRSTLALSTLRSNNPAGTRAVSTGVPSRRI
jgi:hypothetical protein